jgi:hypothetical protein
MAALAAEAADDRPRASMMAAPRFCDGRDEVSVEPGLVADQPRRRSSR